jgi:hypothetical protein
MRRSTLIALVMLGCGSEEAPGARSAEPAAESEHTATPAPAADPAAFCAHLARENIARGCERVIPQAPSARARLRIYFDLLSVTSEDESDRFDGSVMSFDDAEDFDSVVRGYEEAAFVAGPHRYGNRARLLFVQLNHDTPLEVGDRVRAMVEAL